ncbi:CCDC174 family protein [Sporobolomyces koalae]|uniref:CCDC174 family protein n=1 Tax=Sporobolomyces koalae TaxID=500713 RepID=UPI0031803669
MPPSKSSKLAISSSSFLDLKATISAHESDFKKSRTSVVQGGNSATSSSKSSKLSQWSKQNKGLSSRAAKDQVLYEDDVGDNGQGNPEKIKQRLEQKAKIYDKIRRGKSGGLNEAQIDSLLVDFDREPDASEESASDSDQPVDESLTVPERPKRARSVTPDAGPHSSSDPLVEFTDEFGRTRMIPRSEVPRGAPFNSLDSNTYVPVEEESTQQRTGVFQPGEGPQASNVIYGDQTTFPVYAPDPAILAQRAATLAAAQNAPLVDHYDSTKETTRQRGAGFYQFSGTEDERRQQMESLELERQETERKRAERQLEGDRVRQQRKLELEERKRLVEDKRRELEDKRKRRKAA